MNETIIHFINQQTCATVCCTDASGKPWCFNCFYVFNATDGLLYYKSSPQAHHSRLVKQYPAVAGSILPDKLNKLLVKGVQFDGVLLETGHPFAELAAAHYYRKNPLAMAMPGDVCTIQLSNIKMTDNTKGFGHKIYWSRKEKDVAVQ